MNPDRLDQAARQRCFDRNLSEVATGFTLRFSARFLHPKFALLRREWLGEGNTFALKSLCARPIRRGVQPEYDDSDIYAVKTGTLKNGMLDWTQAQTVSEDFFESTKRRAGLRRDDVLVSSTGVGSLGKVDIYERGEPALADSHISIIRIHADRHEPALLAQLMRHRFVQWQIEQGLTGSTNQTDIYPAQLGSLRLPRLSDSIRAQLSSELSRIERDIACLRDALRTPGDVIDEILCAEFGYPLAEHRKRERIRHFDGNVHDMAASFMLRNSARFHHPDFEIIERFFSQTPHERLKMSLAIPIRLGVTATQADLIEEGDAYYVHPGATKRQGTILLEDCHQVTQKFYDTNQRRFALHPGDVIINRSGEALGKVAIFESEDEPALASDFTMRVRFNDRMNPRFAWFFFRSVIFQSQIMREVRGSSVPNIFPAQVAQMNVVSCSRLRQDALAERIGGDLADLEAERASVESKKQEIDRLINAALSA